MPKSKDYQPPALSNTQRNNTFWLNTWRDKQQYGFHQNRVNPLLQRFWHRLKSPVNSRVLVPLCGKSLDMLWLAEQGCDVIGVELSPVAVKAFFRENGLAPHKERIGNFVRWRSGRIVIWCGDFFALTRQQLGRIDAVFDRAALTSLPENWKNAYVRQLINLITCRTPLLLLTIEDLAEGTLHTPQVIDEGLAALCKGVFTVKLLHSEVMDINNAEQNGALTAHARAYLLDTEQQ